MVIAKVVGRAGRVDWKSCLLKESVSRRADLFIFGETRFLTWLSDSILFCSNLLPCSRLLCLNHVSCQQFANNVFRFLNPCRNPCWGKNLQVFWSSHWCLGAYNSVGNGIPSMNFESCDHEIKLETWELS